MSTTRVCMSLCVRGAIRNLQASRSKRTGFQNKDGSPATKAEAIDALMDELAKGHETIPMGSKCGNPCGNAGCAGFEFGELGGCPGYRVEGDMQ